MKHSITSKSLYNFTVVYFSWKSVISFYSERSRVFPLFVCLYQTILHLKSEYPFLARFQLRKLQQTFTQKKILLKNTFELVLPQNLIIKVFSTELKKKKKFYGILVFSV